MSKIERERSLAVFVDLENLAMGFSNPRKTKFDIQKVLERQEQDEQQLATDLYADMPERKREVYSLLLEACNALRRENHEVLYASMIKDTMKRKKPSFNETYHGYRTFSELLEDAAQHGLLELDTDKRSRTYVVTRFGSELHHEAASAADAILPLPSSPVPGPSFPRRSASPRRSGCACRSPAPAVLPSGHPPAAR